MTNTGAWPESPTPRWRGSAGLSITGTTQGRASNPAPVWAIRLDRRTRCGQCKHGIPSHILSEAFGDGSEQHSAFDDPRGLLTSRNTRTAATDPGTTIGFTYDARGYLLTRQQCLSGQGETFTHDYGTIDQAAIHGGIWKVEYGYDFIRVPRKLRSAQLSGLRRGREAFRASECTNDWTQARS
jgi:YD repeat-containing protein